MSLLDETLRLDIRKKALTIIRTPTNVTTYMVSQMTGAEIGKRRLEPLFDYEVNARFPSTSGIVSGDLGYSGSDYFLVMAIEEISFSGAVVMYKTTLYKCNSTISIYYFNSSTNEFTTLHASGIHCLITQVRAQGWDEDRAIVVPQYRGRQQPFQLFLQATAGIVSGTSCVITDQTGREFRVSKEIDVFIASGIAQAQILWSR